MYYRTYNRITALGHVSHSSDLPLQTWSRAQTDCSDSPCNLPCNGGDRTLSIDNSPCASDNDPDESTARDDEGHPPRVSDTHTPGVSASEFDTAACEIPPASASAAPEASVRPDSRPGTRPDTSAADDLLREQLAAYREARVLTCRGNAATIRALSVAYGIAVDRDANDDSVGWISGKGDNGFAGHLLSVVGEIAVANTSSDLVLRNRAHDAHILTSYFPSWIEHLDAADVEYAHLQALLRHRSSLSEEQYEPYGQRLLEYAIDNTPQQTARKAAALAALLAREEFAAAHERAHEERGVTIEHGPAGMSTICADVSTPLAVAIEDLLHQQARMLRDENKRDAAECASDDDFVADRRTIPQLMADLFADTLLTGMPQQAWGSTAPGGRRVTATINVVVPVLSLLTAHRREPDEAADRSSTGANGSVPPIVSARNTRCPSACGNECPTANLTDCTGGECTETECTVAEHTGTEYTGCHEAITGWTTDQHDEPAALNGTIPLSLSQVQDLTRDSELSFFRILTDPITGQTLATDRRLPDAQLRRFIQSRDQTCRFPGCIRPAHRCDIDHTVAWEDGGPTCHCNLEALCKRHHTQKHHRSWQLRILPGGIMEWTSPLGQVIIDPPRSVGPVFVPVSASTDPTDPPF